MKALTASLRGLAALALCAAVLLLLPARGLAAQGGYSVIRSIVIPPIFYVGDRAELRLRIQAEKGQRVAPPDRLPADPYLTIDQVVVNRLDGDFEVRIFFESYAPGENAIPPIRLGGITLTGLAVHTASLATGSHATLSEPKGQLFLPGSGLILALIVGGLLGLPTLLFVSIRAGRRLLALLVARREFARPWQRLRAALLRLERPEAYGDARAFYILVCDELRHYLGDRVAPDYLTATAREFAPLTARAFPDLPQANATVEVMSFADQVKFAGAEASEETMRRDAARVRQAAEAIEARFRALRDPKGRGAAHVQL